MTNENLYLVGTAHIDLAGPKRLEGLLNCLSPDIVALEFHKDREFAIEERKKVSPEEEERETDKVLQEVGLNLTIEQRRTMLEGGRDISAVMGYEHKVSKAYTDANPKSRLEYIDISIFENGIEEFRQGYIAAMKGVLTQVAQEPELRKPFFEMLDKGKKGFLEQSMAGVVAIYENAEMMGELAEVLRDPETYEAMKGQLPPNAIQALEQIYNPKRDDAMANKINELYNSGNHRLVAVTGLMHTPGLKSRIADLNPTIMTLADYDSN